MKARKVSKKFIHGRNQFGQARTLVAKLLRGEISHEDLEKWIQGD